MNNETTPLKAAFCGLIATKLVALLGLDQTDAAALSTGLWVALSAALAYVLPSDFGFLRVFQ